MRRSKLSLREIGARSRPSATDDSRKSRLEHTQNLVYGLVSKQPAGNRESSRTRSRDFSAEATLDRSFIAQGVTRTPSVVLAGAMHENALLDSFGRGSG